MTEIQPVPPRSLPPVRYSPGPTRAGAVESPHPPGGSPCATFSHSSPFSAWRWHCADPEARTPTGTPDPARPEEVGGARLEACRCAERPDAFRDCHRRAPRHEIHLARGILSRGGRYAGPATPWRPGGIRQRDPPRHGQGGNRSAQGLGRARAAIPVNLTSRRGRSGRVPHWLADRLLRPSVGRSPAGALQ